jgi:hypothetical protein
MAQKIDTGDTMLHMPTGGKLIVAFVSGDFIMPCDWPERYIPLRNLELTRKATPEERLKVLHEMAHLKDNRGFYARGVLSQPSEEA